MTSDADAVTEAAAQFDPPVEAAIEASDDFGAAVERIATALEQIAHQLKELRTLLSRRLQ